MKSAKGLTGLAFLTLAAVGATSAQNAPPPAGSAFPQRAIEGKAKSDADQVAYVKAPDIEGPEVFSACLYGYAVVVLQELAVGDPAQAFPGSSVKEAVA